MSEATKARYTEVNDLLIKMIYWTPAGHGSDGIADPILYNCVVVPPGDHEGEGCNVVILLIATSKNPDVPIYCKCLCDGDGSVQPGATVTRTDILVPSSLATQLVNSPGRIAVQRIRYTWLLGAKMVILAVDDIMDELLAVKSTKTRSSKKPKDTDPVMEILKRTLPRKRKNPSSKRKDKKSGGTRKGRKKTGN